MNLLKRACTMLFGKEMRETYLTVATLLVSIASIVTSVRQSELARNSAYLPCIKVEILDNVEEIKLTWDSESTLDSSEIPQIHMRLTNIGNGNANNVRIEFDSRVLTAWQKKLEEMNPDIGLDYTINKKNFLVDVPYILMGKENAVTIDFPNAYLECLNQLYRWKDITNTDSFELPNIRMTIIYEDIQGKVMKYDIECRTSIKENMYIDSSEGNSIIMNFEFDELEN